MEKRFFYSIILLLTVGSPVSLGQSVNYPPDFCAVSGSTTTVPCSFTPPQTYNDGGRPVRIKVVRVRWCQNHLICQGSTPSVYDSDPPSFGVINDPRYRYLGDLERDCSLQISNVKKEDGATLRFRMEVNHTSGHVTGQPGVRLVVTEGVKMRIRISSGDRTVMEGETVTLRCTTNCTSDQLKVDWFRDGHALSESGADLQLGPLSAEDSGNYVCALRSQKASASEAWSLNVEQEDGGTEQNLLIVRVVLFTLHTFLIITAATALIRRTCFQRKASAEV